MTEDKSNARKYALTVVLMIIAISLVFTGAEASSGSGETTQWNAGTSSCTITAGNTQCSNLFTWTPTPLSAAPCSGCAEATPTSATGSINDQTIIGASVDSVFFSIGNDFGTAGKWLSMPNAQTEIFGDNGQHWIIVNWSNAQNVDFTLNCPAASNTAGATLQIQYSTDQGATWNSIATLAINVNLYCGLGIPVDSFLSNTGTTWGCYIAVPAGAKSDGLFLRIIGSGGGGLGDNPQFQSAHVIMQGQPSTVRFTFSVSISSASATTILIIGKISVSQTGSTTINWRMSAWICRAGGSGPC